MRADQAVHLLGRDAPPQDDAMSGRQRRYTDTDASTSTDASECNMETLKLPLRLSTESMAENACVQPAAGKRGLTRCRSDSLTESGLTASERNSLALLACLPHANKALRDGRGRRVSVCITKTELVETAMSGLLENGASL